MAGDHDDGGRLPDGRPAWVSDELVDDTIRLWSPRYPEPLTEDDAVEMLLRVGELHDLASGHPPAARPDGDSQ
jgi:hypothetical protein